MDDKNNKLEDFFNQSLNQFDDSPSDAVWEGLQERLDSERTLWEKWTTSIRKYLPYLLLLLCLGIYHLIAQQKITQLTTNIETIQEEKLALGMELQDCSQQTANLLTDVKLKSDELLNNSTQIASLEEDISALSKKNILLNNRNKLKFTPPFFNPNQNTLYDSNILTKKNVEDQVSKNTPIEGERAILNKNNDKDLVIETKSKKQYNFNNQLFINSKRPSLLYQINSRHINTIKYNRPIDPLDAPSKLHFRIGYQYKAFHTINNSSDLINYGDMNGLRMELIFNNNFAITGGMHYKQQAYHVTNNGNAIMDADLVRFPFGDSFTNQVTEIKVHTQFLDFPLGIKWHFKQLSNGLDLYINPAVVWQISFPQEFDYTFSNNTSVRRENNQTFGSFGSFNVQLGIEKVIKNNLIWQIGIWGEKSFVALGAENHSSTILGLHTAILFQK